MIKEQNRWNLPLPVYESENTVFYRSSITLLQTYLPELRESRTPKRIAAMITASTTAAIMEPTIIFFFLDHLRKFNKHNGLTVKKIRSTLSGQI